MRKLIWTMIGVCGLAPIGCKSVSEPARSDGLIPLEVGRVWTYEGDVPGGSAADTVSASTRFNSRTYYKVTGGLLGRFLREDDWIRNAGDDVMVYDSGTGIEDTLFAGSAAVGEVWDPWSDEFCLLERCPDITKVETPAGIYENVACFETCFVIPDAGYAYAIESEVGIVRYVWITIGGTMSLDLTGFSSPSEAEVPLPRER